MALLNLERMVLFAVGLLLGPSHCNQYTDLLRHFLLRYLHNLSIVLEDLSRFLVMLPREWPQELPRV